MRQMDVEKLLHKYGHERGSVHVLMRLAEEQEHIIRTMKEMAAAFEQITTVVTMQNAVMDKTKGMIDSMSKHFDTDPRSTHAMVRGTDRWEDNDE